MRDPFGTGAALTLIFILLHITTTSADNCMGYCSGMYMCGWNYCFCPAASYESSCPYGCIFTPTDCDNDDFNDDSNGSSNGLSTGAIVGIVVAVILALIAAVAGVYAYMIVRRNKTSPNHSSSKQTGVSAGTTPSPPIEVQLSSHIPVATASPEQKSDFDIVDKA